MERVKPRPRVTTIQEGIELVIEDELASREPSINPTLTCIVTKKIVTKRLEKRSITKRVANAGQSL